MYNKNNFTNLNDEIEEIRDKLNESISLGEDPNKILKISQQLDKLLSLYYRKKNNQVK
ncbi:aspartyl-phosphate phosphatase Spo0E family protein [Clostridiisalibacter paucivorans]|uniref:aspartyl-phosphate phosphatase Spo0E family protein n=1 Tax=Clostridiisalibacter paucivorans TaxID=408753 RepID=UPI0009FFEE74|nr:aspartyl-phosphate phosphatase Spo0E family protein [Clostridiisalibacter paucivorans]